MNALWSKKVLPNFMARDGIAGGEGILEGILLSFLPLHVPQCECLVVGHSVIRPLSPANLSEQVRRSVEKKKSHVTISAIS